MITKWSLSNFKSVSKETELSFAPLTLFAGPNSSGKSTVLQSLLLVSQTLAHKVSSRSVVLNGLITRLGQFDDLKSHESEYDQITIGWECQPLEGAQTSNLENSRLPSHFMIYGKRNDAIKTITCKLSFDANPGSPDRELYQLQPRLFLFTISALVSSDDNADRRHELTVSRSSAESTKIDNLNAEVPNDAARASLEFNVDIDNDSLEELREEYMTAEPVGCVFRHFLPDRLSIRINTVKEFARMIRMALMDDGPRIRRSLFMKREFVIPYPLIKELQSQLDEKYPILFEKQSTLFDGDEGIAIRDWIERLRKLPFEKRRELRRTLTEWPDLVEIIERNLRVAAKKEDKEYLLLPFPLPANLMNASSYLGAMFSNSVKYLGPLRDEPKPLYPLTAHADPTDVGFQGEMTAAVLNLHRERKIRYISSSAFAKTPFLPTPVTRSLEAAVTDWLQYLGVAETAYSIDKGKLGHELKVKLSEDGPTHDLTHVGVGVSQVLPIVVMSLLADRDTTLIFEQPELHLHPKVQTRLADFFLSIVLLGKQCLIETHSEYLINRLRYRTAAEDDNNRVNESLKIYFVEKKDGSSDFREVKVNEYGAILEWPKGFFDQSQFESESILRAAAAKRKRQKGK